jgi:ferredoxin-like protein FixX
MISGILTVCKLHICKIFKPVSVYQFADDTCLITADSDVEAATCRMLTEFDTLCKWAHDVGLSCLSPRYKQNYNNVHLFTIHKSYCHS